MSEPTRDNLSPMKPHSVFGHFFFAMHFFDCADICDCHAKPGICTLVTLSSGIGLVSKKFREILVFGNFRDNVLFSRKFLNFRELL